jgi:signal transduction histidine kinase
MSSTGVLERWQRSLAVRLSVWFALLFTLGFGAIFGGLYYKLGAELESQEAEALELRVRQYASVYNLQGLAGLRSRLAVEGDDPNVLNLFIEFVFPDDSEPFIVKVPPSWIEGEVDRALVRDISGALVEQRTMSVRVPENEDQDVLHAFQPLADGNGLHIARTAESRRVLLRPLRATFLWIGAGVVVFGFAAGLLVARRATRPLSDVIATARRIIATGTMEARVPTPRRRDEVADLVTAFNTVLDKNAGLLRSMREALDNVAHDLRTPLTRLRGTAEVALRGGGSQGAANEALADCVEQADDVLQLLRVMMEISEAEAGMLKLDRKPTELGELARDAADLYSEVAEAKSVQLSCELPMPTPIEADVVRLRQAIANLIDNAIKYTPEGGRVTIETSRQAGESVLRISDTGPGIPEADQARIWERLYRGDSSRSQRGLGLGLSMVRAIVEAHGGHVSQSNRPEGGAVFELTLPLRR